MVEIRDGETYLIGYNGNTFRSVITIKDGKYHAYNNDKHISVKFSDDSIKLKAIKVEELKMKHKVKE